MTTASLPAVPMADLARDYLSAREEIDAAVHRVLLSGHFIAGPEVAAFEAEFAAWLGVRHAVACASGTEAIALALLALGVGPGDEVIVPVNTCMPTASGIAMTGARPVGADVDPRTLMLDPASCRAARTPRTKAVVPVHLYGSPADMDSLGALGLPLVEDCAQAHGTRWKGRTAGTFGAASCFSFYPTKNLGAFGDAGLVATDAADLADKLRLLRCYGYRVRDRSELVGLNSRMDELQAAILRVKLRRLDAANGRRRALARRLREALSGLAFLTLPDVPSGGESTHHLFPVLCRERERLAAHLKAAGIATGVHYPVPLHLQPCHRSWNAGPGTFPTAERAAETVLSLPLFPQMTDDELGRVIDAVRAFPT